MITFTTTATYRPELLKQTFESFTKNITDLDFSKTSLVINIDPLPIVNKTMKDEIIEICNFYFGNVHFNFSSNGNFPNSLKYVWSQTKTDYVFNLEDDWILLEKIKIQSLIDLLKQNDKAIGVSLNAYLFNVNKHRIRLSPGLFDGSWARNASSVLTPDMCPEQQLRTKVPQVLQLNYPAYNLAHEGRIIVKDIGRAWRNSKKLRRDESQHKSFTTWR